MGWNYFCIWHIKIANECMLNTLTTYKQQLTHPLLQWVPSGTGVVKLEVVEVDGHLPQERIAPEPVVVPHRHPKSAILQLRLCDRVLWKYSLKHLFFLCITYIYFVRYGLCLWKSVHKYRLKKLVLNLPGIL